MSLFEDTEGSPEAEFCAEQGIPGPVEWKSGESKWTPAFAPSMSQREVNELIEDQKKVQPVPETVPAINVSNQKETILKRLLKLFSRS